MKLPILYTLAAMALTASAAEPVTLFDHVPFYDGYMTDVIYDGDVDDGILRLSNSLYARKITDSQLDMLGEPLRLDVLIGALCDNYDRMGCVNLTFVPKGSDYDATAGMRVEIARFITPFMNKNRKPDEVPYSYDIAGLGMMLTDKEMRAKYDAWIELEVFGVPYSAQTQVKGCAGRTDTFSGTLSLVRNGAAPEAGSGHTLVPVTMRKSEIEGFVNFNNYKPEACDTLGVTSKTYEFTVPHDLADAKLVLINSNHGAAENGEEYVRRRHLVYVDGEIMLDYTPGGVSCEPYRKYNTQGNFIYAGVTVGGEYVPPTDDWEEWSNWCPGQAVPVREIHLGAVKAGGHKVLIRVPEAEFYNKDGDFRPSIYLQGVTDGKMPLSASSSLADISASDASLSIDGGILSFRFADGAEGEMRLYSYDGALLYGLHAGASELDLNRFGKGIYIVSLTDGAGRSLVKKVIV